MKNCYNYKYKLLMSVMYISIIATIFPKQNNKNFFQNLKMFKITFTKKGTKNKTFMFFLKMDKIPLQK